MAPSIELVVTAARAAQARGYEALLQARAQAGDLPPSTRWRVVTDPHDQRAGSGAATALAMLEVVRDLPGRTIRERLDGRRMVIIHSGGDSRRLPAFAAAGKAFAPLPRSRPSGAPAALLDLVLDDLLRLPAPARGQVLVASGDAVIGAGDESIDLDHEGVVGIAQAGSAARANRHGVYMIGRDGLVRGFLQKPKPTESRRAGAMLKDGTVLIDTGIVSFSPSAAERLLHGFGATLRRGRWSIKGLLAAVQAGAVGNIDLYHHVLLALVPGRKTDRSFLGALGVEQGAPLASLLLQLRAALQGVPFVGRRCGGTAFLHAGTTREYLDLLLRGGATGRRFGVPDSPSALRHVGSAGCRIRAAPGCRAAVVGSLDASLTLGGENLVVGLPPGSGAHLPRGVGCFAIPIRTAALRIRAAAESWAMILVHRNDDPKRSFDQGGTLLGRSITAWCRRHRVERSDLDGGSFWDARLWLLESRLRPQSWMVEGGAAPQRWKSARRWSLAEILGAVSHRTMLELESEITRRTFVEEPLRALASNEALGAEQVAKQLGPADRQRAARTLRAQARRAAPLLAARGFAVAARLRGEGVRSREALAAVSRAVPSTVADADACPEPGISREEAVRASAPARVDLAGGWSDTPPMCQEVGGAVVNLAVALDGRMPIHVLARRLKEPVLAIHSIDLDRSMVVRTTHQAHDHRDPRDWTALAKAALRLAGLVPPRHGPALAHWLKPFGGGLSLTTCAGVPKGSGLGTSSILGATTLACLDRVTGRKTVRRELVARTSELEQLIATRGGWQDQVGGVEPGFKCATTKSGATQHPRIQQLVAPPSFVAALEARTVFCFTGLRRMARDILERVVDRYLCRDAGVLELMHQLRMGALAMSAAIESGDLDRFAAIHREYWKLKTTLDPYATTPAIERAVAPLQRELAAWSLPGAGGGGFLFLLARSERSAQRVREQLTLRPIHAQSRVVPWSVAQESVRASCG